MSETDNGDFESEPEPKKGYTHVPPTTPNSDLTQLDCALNYVAIGYPVFPTKSDKKPYTEHGFHDASTDPTTIRSWWTCWPEAGIGAPMGKRTGLFALDSDPDKGGDVSLSELIFEHGDLPPTQEVSTPRKGRHFYFNNPTDVEIRNSESKIGPGLDIRGEGGYVVLPGCDPSRSWVATLAPADAPAWLIEAALSKKGAPLKTGRKQFSNPFAGAGARVFPEGERNNGLRDVALGRWIHGYATDAQDLYQQMLQVKAERCALSGDPHDKSITDEWLYDLVIRTTRNYARGVLKGRTS